MISALAGFKKEIRFPIFALTEAFQLYLLSSNHKSFTPSLQLINEYLPENVVFITEEAPPGQVATELCLKNMNA